MAIIVPAILEDTTEKFQKQYDRVMQINGVSRMHIDFCDGTFVPRTSLAIADLPPLDASLHLEAHLMHHQPKDFETLRDLGFSTIIVHAESYEDPENLREALQNIMLLGMKPAIALNPETTVEELINLDIVIGHITALSVHPGHQGSAFLPEVLEKLKVLKAEFPDAILQIDGGMNQETAPQAVNNGADLLVVGSDLLSAKDMQDEFNQLTVIAESV